MALARIRKYQDAAGALEDEGLVTLDAEAEKDETPTTGADDVEEIPAEKQAAAKEVATEQEVSPTKERQKYKYAGAEIDLECYIKNLRHNVSNYIDSKTSWSQQRKEAFWASFEEYMQALSDCRLSANYRGTIQDTESVLHNNPMSYVMADGSVCSREEVDSLRKRQKRFNDIFDSNGDVAYYFKWVADGQLDKEEEEARIAEEEQRRKDEKYKKDHVYSDAKWGVQSAFNAGYNPYMERMDWEYFMQQDEKDEDGNYSIDKRCGSMAGFIRNTYLPDIEDVDFSKTKWHNRETFLKAIDTVLQDLDSNIVDKGHMIEAGFDPLFVQNFFAKNKSEIKYWDEEQNRPIGGGDGYEHDGDDDERYIDSLTATEENTIKKIIQDILNVEVDNLDVESGSITDIDLKFPGRGNNVKNFATGPGNYLSQFEKTDWLEKVSDIYAYSGNNGYDLESAISKLGYGERVTDASGNDIAIYLRAYFEACQANNLVAKNANETGYFLEMTGNDFKNWYVYLPSINIEDGTCLLYNPVAKKYKRIRGIEVNQLKGLYNYEIFSQLILPERDSSVVSHRWGGLVLYAGGGSQMALDRRASVARESSEKAMHTYEEKAEARAHDPNNHVLIGARDTSYNENVSFTAQDYSRLGAIVLDIAAIVDPDMLSSVALNLASTGVNVWADIKDGLSAGKVVGNALLNAGFSLVSLIPMVGSSIASGAKIVRVLGKMVPKITRALGLLIGAGTLAVEGPEIIKSFEKINKDGPENKLTLKDFKNIGIGISSILTLKGSINGMRTAAAQKSWNAGYREVTVHRVMDSKGNIKTTEELSKTSLKRIGQVTSDETTLVYELGPNGKPTDSPYVVYDQDVRADMEAARSKGPGEVVKVVKEYYPSLRNKNLFVESKTEMEGRKKAWQLWKSRTPHEYAVFEHAKGEDEGYSWFNAQKNYARNLHNQKVEKQILLDNPTATQKARAQAALEQRAAKSAEKEATPSKEATAEEGAEKAKSVNEGAEKVAESKASEESKGSEFKKNEVEVGDASQFDADASSESKEKGATKAPTTTAEGALEKAKSMAKADAEAVKAAEEAGLGGPEKAPVKTTGAKKTATSKKTGASKATSKKSGGSIEERVSRLLGSGGYVPFWGEGGNDDGQQYNYGSKNATNYNPGNLNDKYSQWGDNFDVSSLNLNSANRNNQIGNSFFQNVMWERNATDQQKNVNQLLSGYDQNNASKDLFDYYQKWKQENEIKEDTDDNFNKFLFDYNTNIDKIQKFHENVKWLADPQNNRGLTWTESDNTKHQLNDERFKETLGDQFSNGDLNISEYNKLMSQMFGSINGGQYDSGDNGVTRTGYAENNASYLGSATVTRALPVRDAWLTYSYNPSDEEYRTFMDLGGKSLYFTSDGHIAIGDPSSKQDTGEDESGLENNVGEEKKDTVPKSPSTGSDVLANIGVQGLRRDNDPISANLYEMANLLGGIAVNNKIAKVKNPIMLHDPLESTEWVRGKESAIQQARRAAGRYQHIANENATSDAQRNAAYQLEATEKGNEALEKGWTVDNEAIEKTRQAVVNQAKVNAESRYTVADANRQNILSENIERQTRLAANKAKNWENISSWLMQHESDKREADEDKRQMQEKFLPYQLKNHIYANLEQYFGGENGWSTQDIALMRAINDRVISPHMLYSSSGTAPSIWDKNKYGDFDTAYQRYIQCSAAINDLQTASLAAYYGITYEKARVVANSQRPDIQTTPGQTTSTDADESSEESGSDNATSSSKFGGVLFANGGSVSSVEIQKLRNKAKRMELLVKTLNMKMTDFQKSLDRAQKGARDYIKSQTGR